jgi:hypothetical protein
MVLENKTRVMEAVMRANEKAENGTALGFGRGENVTRMDGNRHGNEIH